MKCAKCKHLENKHLKILGNCTANYNRCKCKGFIRVSQKKDEYGVCLINVNDDASIISPCLKETGHKGEHQHIGLCKSKSCFCPKGIGFLIKKDCCNEAFEAGAKQERERILRKIEDEFSVPMMKLLLKIKFKDWND